jgi:hypothetical protein
MGIIKRGILGGFSGRIGNVVGSSWKGLAVVKSLPLSVANPRTTAQTTQRSKFSNTVAFGSLLLTNVIKPLWDRAAVYMSGFNAFVQANVGLMPSGADPDLEGLVISEGPLGTLADVTATPNYVAGTVAFTFDNSASGAYQSVDDRIIGFAYSQSDGLIGFDDGTVKRSDGAMTIDLGGTLREPNVIFYGLVALSPDGFKPGAELSKKVG